MFGFRMLGAESSGSYGPKVADPKFRDLKALELACFRHVQASRSMTTIRDRISLNSILQH